MCEDIRTVSQVWSVGGRLSKGIREEIQPIGRLSKGIREEIQPIGRLSKGIREGSQVWSIGGKLGRRHVNHVGMGNEVIEFINAIFFHSI